ncbi:MAG: F0F1 ATP synthase subunit gamma [Anaerolineae bacterium]|jgi:F-type H+-transporting ATPase subunit gamma
MEQIERAQERLENIRGVKPILGGLRTISLGSWQAALKRRSGVRDYALRLEALLPSLILHVDAPTAISARLRRRLLLRVPLPARAKAEGTDPSRRERVEALVVGSERGLCGRFNVAIADEVDRYLKTRTAGGVEVNLQALGSRVERVLARRGLEAGTAGTLSVATLPPFSLAFGLTRRWLEAYEQEDLDAVDVIYNGYRGTGAHKPRVARLIPPRLPREDQTARPQPERPWPPPIIETDPHSIYASVVEQLAAVQLYEILLEAAAAEHSTRFQLMETATQNADRLIEELTLITQTARRQGITQELAELAAGAGLIGRK